MTFWRYCPPYTPSCIMIVNEQPHAIVYGGVMNNCTYDHVYHGHYTIFTYPYLCFAGAGAYAGCCYCDSKGEYCQALTKMVCLGHRRFLTPTDPLRRVDQLVAVRVFLKTLLTQKPWNNYVDTAKKKTLQISKDCSKEEGYCTSNRMQRAICVAKTTLPWSLPQHSNWANAPHKNVVEHIVRLIVGAEDSEKIREEEHKRHRFHSSWVVKKQTRLPAALFRPSTCEQKIANARAQSINVPIGFDWRPEAMFAMKSHAWKLMVSTAILKYCLRNLLGEWQRQTQVAKKSDCFSCAAFFSMLV